MTYKARTLWLFVMSWNAEFCEIIDIDKGLDDDRVGYIW